MGTIFEDSPIGLDKWIVAVWLVVNCKNGVSSYEIGRHLGVTQKFSLVHESQDSEGDAGRLVLKARWRG